MAQQTIVAYFETRADAENARDALTDAGIASAAIRLLPEEGSATSYTRSSTDTAYDYREDKGGFWASLGNLFIPDDDRYAYAEGMSRGGITLSVITDEADYDRVTDMLEEYGSVDLDEREAEWKSQGWSGYRSDTATTGAMGVAAAGSSSTTGTDYAGRAVGDAADIGDDGTIKVMEEQLRVGKRQVDKGRVRIRSYVVETPVQESVDLRSERVYLERRPVDRALTGDEVAFTDRVIEASEHREEAVVSKEARVTEEIGLRREADQRTETVSDTVRRTEVEIDDERLEVDRAESNRPVGHKPVAR